jgi:hypothetical protein
VDALRANGVTNAVFVWHSACSPTYGGHPPPPANRDCFVEHSSDLKNWTLLPTVVRNDVVSADVTLNNLPPDKLFLRLHIP